MSTVNKLSLYCIALSTLSLIGVTPNVFKDKQSFDDTVHAFVTLGKNVGDPAVKIGLPFMYLYQSGDKTYAKTPVDFLAAFGAYAAYEEFKALTGKQFSIPHLDANQFEQDSNKKAAADVLNTCIDLTNKGIDLATPLVTVWLLKTACKQLD
jgi:hypothetical protein